MASSTERVKDALAALDIIYTDFPDSPEFVQWLIDQSEGAHDGALSAIALTGTELRLHQSAEALQLVPRQQPGLSRWSTARSFDPKLVQDEITLLETEAELLKNRIQQTNGANLNILQSIQKLQHAVSALDGETDTLAQELSEISISSDSSVNIATGAAKTLLDEWKFALTTPNAQLDKLMGARARRIESFHVNLDAIGAAQPSEDVFAEAHRLQQVFDNLCTPLSADRGLLKAETDKILDMSKSNDAEELGKIIDDELERGKTFIIEQIQNAWCNDQNLRLLNKSKCIDEAIQGLDNDVASHLIKLHDHLVEKDSYFRELEALVGALVEEIEEIVDELPVKEEASKGNATQVASLKESIARLLEKSGEATHVHLDEEDMLLELERIQKSQSLDDEWASDIETSLSALINRQSPLMSATYRNSPWNTSRPFTVPSEVAQLESKARDTIQELSKLAKDKTTTNTHKQTAAFVQRWDK